MGAEGGSPDRCAIDGDGRITGSSRRAGPKDPFVTAILNAATSDGNRQELFFESGLRVCIPNVLAT
jgi:hypothetical protein